MKIEKAREIADKLFSLLILVMSVAFFITSFSLPAQAAMLPRWISLATAILILPAIVKLWRKKTEAGEEKVVIPFFIGAVYLLVYYVLINLFGFTVSTAVFTAVLSKHLGLKNWILVILLALVLSFGLAYIFGTVFSVAIPKGILLKNF